MRIIVPLCVPAADTHELSTPAAGRQLPVDVREMCLRGPMMRPFDFACTNFELVVEVGAHGWIAGAGVDPEAVDVCVLRFNY